MGTGELQGHVLRFHKRGVDNSGKCDAFCTGLAQDRVWGALFEMDLRDQPRLDKEESLGCGYNRVNLTIHVNGSETGAFSYLAEKSYIDDTLVPYCWYKAYVLEGARSNGLPDRYIEKQIDSVVCLPDPQPLRERRHYAILNNREGANG